MRVKCSLKDKETTNGCNHRSKDGYCSVGCECSCIYASIEYNSSNSNIKTCLWCKRPVTDENKLEHIHTINT